ncbi:hypothetical protein FRC07_008427 [Ceratobasidium sp. 392]|nr:hypothetical protein FRC07_008427 [Ceratobasidium sp. 392]
MDCTGTVIQQLRSREFLKMLEYANAETPTNGLNRRYYSWKQMGEVLVAKDEHLKTLRLEGLALNRSTKHIFGKLSDHKQLMLALAESDDAAASRIVRVALHQGCSASAIVERLAKAQQGLYHCKSYSKKDVDIALLVLRLGGPRLLFALSKALDLPSSSTVLRATERSYLRPSIGFPTMAEVLANMKSICAPAQAVVPRTRGFTLMIDEIALEERIRYSTAEDALVGVCREHASVPDLQNMTGRPISHFAAIRSLLDAGKCHRAKEATVVALAPFGYSNYNPMVVS